MTWLLVLSVVGAVFALGTLVMTIVNLRTLARDPGERAGAVGSDDLVVVCIPARNEEANLEPCVRCVLAQEGVRVVALVYDDQSGDGTGEVLAGLAREDERVMGVASRALPEGWVGKQWACHNLAARAREIIESEVEGGADPGSGWMVFIDADVRLEDPRCLAVAVSEARRLGAGLISTFPRQVLGSVAEALTVPMIHFILFSYLPFPRMRRTMDPSACAACGQFMLFSSGAYTGSGGHGAVRGSMHDGVLLPRLVRRAGHRTDLFDGTGMVSCRMYDGFASAYRGFLKNAYEGLGSVGLLVFLTVVHLVGHVWPTCGVVFVGGALLLGVVGGSLWWWTLGWCALGFGLALTQRGMLSARFGQGRLSVAGHAAGVVLMTVIQWHSMVNHKLGRRSWRGRGLRRGGVVSG